MVQIDCSIPFGWYGICTILGSLALGCVNPVATSTSWCNCTYQPRMYYWWGISCQSMTCYCLSHLRTAVVNLELLSTPVMDSIKFTGTVYSRSRLQVWGRCQLLWRQEEAADRLEVGHTEESVKKKLTKEMAGCQPIATCFFFPSRITYKNWLSCGIIVAHIKNQQQKQW